MKLIFEYSVTRAISNDLKVFLARFNENFLLFLLASDPDKKKIRFSLLLTNHCSHRFFPGDEEAVERDAGDNR